MLRCGCFNSYLSVVTPVQYYISMHKLKITLSNTDNLTLQCFLCADFKLLNLTWDLKVGVLRIGKDWFQGPINDLEISHIYVHTDEMVYSKLCHIVWLNSELYKCIVILMGPIHWSNSDLRKWKVSYFFKIL